jgi:hypothetical protein
MSTRELIDRKVDRMPQRNLDRVLAFLNDLNDAPADSPLPGLVAKSSFSEDWPSPEEDAAWANL